MTIVPTTASPTIPSPQALSGSFNFVPALGVGTHTYSMTATGPGGSVLCGVTVTVTPNPAPTCTLDAAPTTIAPGGSSTLSWTTTHATSIVITQGIGSVTANGSTSVSPTVSKTYSLTATGAGGSVTCQQTVVVTTPAAPTCTLNGTPSTVAPGDATALSWTTTNAVTASIDHSVGAVTPIIAGSTAVSVPSTTTYTMTVTSAFGATATCQTTVTTTTVSGPACTISVSSNSIKTGQSITISWTSTNATEGSITGGIGGVSPVSSGSIDMFPPSDTTYVGTFKGPGGTVSCQKSVTVTPGTTGCSGNCGGGLNPPNVVFFKQPGNQPLAFVSLSQIPYTGFAAGPALTILFWLSIGLLSAFIAYYVAGKDGIRFIAGYAGTLTRRTSTDQVNTWEQHEQEREHVYGAPYPTPDVAEQRDAEQQYQASVITPPVVRVATPVQVESAPAVPSRPQAPSVDGIPNIADVIESRAHAAGVLMSPEAVTLAAAFSADRAEALRVFGDILNEAVRTIPRENGWVMLNADRFNELATNQGAAVRIPTAAAFAPREESVEEIKVTSPVDVAVAATFAGAVISGDRNSAFGIIRSLEHDKVSPTALMTSTATVLDALFRARKDNRPSSDAVLAEKATNLSDEKLAHLVNVFTHSLDTVYTSPFTGVKLALAQAFEVVG